MDEEVQGGPNVLDQVDSDVTEDDEPSLKELQGPDLKLPTYTGVKVEDDEDKPSDSNVTLKDLSHEHGGHGDT